MNNVQLKNYNEYEMTPPAIALSDKPLMMYGWNDLKIQMQEHIISRLEHNLENDLPIRINEFQLRHEMVTREITTKKNSSLVRVTMGISWGQNESWLVVFAMNSLKEPVVTYLERVIEPKQSPVTLGFHPHVMRIAEVVRDFRPRLIISDIKSIGKEQHASLRKLLKGRYRMMEGRMCSGISESKKINNAKTFTVKDNRIEINTEKAFLDLTRYIAYRQFATPKPDYRYASVVLKFLEHHLKAELCFETNPISGKTFAILCNTGEDNFLFAHLMAIAGYKITENEN